MKSLAAGTALAASKRDLLITLFLVIEFVKKFSDYKNSFSRVECMCDPVRVDPGLKQENCLRNHKFNERTQRCECSFAHNFHI